jgi:Flp pilus assembly protein TadG
MLTTTNLRRERRGQGMIELALVLPVVLMLVMGVVDFARTYNVQNSLHRVAKEGVNYGTQLTATGGKPTTAEITARMRSAVVPPMVGAALIVNNVQQVVDASGLESVNVDISYDVDMLTPGIYRFFPQGRYRANSKATLPYTQFTKTAVTPAAAQPGPMFTLDIASNTLAVKGNASVRIKILGKQSQCGSGGPNQNVYGKISTDNGANYQNIDNYQPLTGGEEMILTGLTSSSRLVMHVFKDGISGCSDVTLLSNQKTQFSDSSTNFKQYVLADGGVPPSKPGFAGQESLSEYLGPYVNTSTGTMKLGRQDVIMLFEFNSTFNSPASDFQDLVVLVQFFNPGSSPPTTP